MSLYARNPDNLPEGWRVEKVENCTYCLAPTTPPIKVKYTRKSHAVPVYPSPNNPDWRYLLSRDPKNKALLKIPGSARSKLIPDETTGKPRFIVFTWEGPFDRRKKTWPKIKSAPFEIPHWDYDTAAYEVAP